MRRYVLAGLAGMMVGGLLTAATGAFGSGNSGTFNMAAGSNLNVACPNALTNSNHVTNSETVNCAAPATTTTTAPATTTTAPQTTTTVPQTTTTTTVPAGGVTCTTTTNNNCGPYSYPADTASSGFNTYVGLDCFNPQPGQTQSLSVVDPGNWNATLNIPAGDTAVACYPSIGQNSSGSGRTQAITAYTQITSSFAENMNANPQTDAEAAYDIWTVSGIESMIQFDFSALRPRCSADAGDPITDVVSFTEPGTTTAQQWDFCQYGTERIWQLHGGSESSGSVDIKAMLQWEIDHGHLGASEQFGLVGFGVEFCSTGGVPETAQVSQFSLTALPNP